MMVDDDRQRRRSTTTRMKNRPVSQTVLKCVMNAIHLNGATELNLCPPGRARRELRDLLQSRPTPTSTIQEPKLELDYHQITKEYIQEFNYDDSDEEASSGDEDAILDNSDHQDKYSNLQQREPLYISNNATNSKQPFSRRKIRFFDKISPQQRNTARKYVKDEILQAKRNYRLQRLNRSTTSTTTKTKLNTQMTPNLAAALVIESLSYNKTESIEGMGNCYEGIVAAGVAFLDGKSKKDILKSLTQLLISSLDQEAGEAILNIAKLRHMCATPRYQRRFVQRIAPALVRPPNSAIWCLRHQNDMEAVIAATELLLDSASQVFRKGWCERGQALLRDSKREETLMNAAAQLQSMSVSDNGIRKKRMQENSMAKWEVKAVDTQIRASIANALRSDWSNSVLASELSRANFRRNAPTGKRIIPDSPKSMQSSPRSPANRKTPRSPPHMPHNSEPMESVFGPSFASQPVPERPVSPTAFQKKESEIPPKSPTSYKMQIESVTAEESFQLPTSPKRKDSATSVNTPMSPSSVGTAGSAELVSFKPSAASAGAGFVSPTIQYRTLTSTAAERKRTVAACRALRAQISRFEDAFFKMHGRTPKGPIDRAPLASTYAQYREWKRAIRADAACRIQALFRGAYVRWMLLRSGDSKASRVVMRRAGRSRDQKLDLLLPGDISQPDLKPPNKESEMKKVPNATVFPRARLGSNSDSDFSPPALPRVQSGGSSGIHIQPNLSHESDSSGMSLSELQAKKRDLKQQLKQYDMNFARKHGRMPVKAEKEPIRHLYEEYNALKSQITSLESEGRSGPISSVAASSPPPSPEPASRRAVSPSGSDSQGSDESPLRSSNFTPAPRAKRNVPRSSSPSMSPGTQDLASLKIEKSQLHQMLRTYEKDFYKDHKRQVSSFADIKPVASQYRRYKEIKKAIAALQESER